jgi:hypothetical protein
MVAAAGIVRAIFGALLVNRIEDLSAALGLFDGRVIDGLGVNGLGWLARAVSRFAIWWDQWVVDGVLGFAGKFVQLLSAPARMFQTGVFSSYAVLMLLGLAVLLGYYGHHMQVWVRSLH